MLSSANHRLPDAQSFSFWGKRCGSCSDDRLKILSDLSQAILKHPRSRQYPDLVSFGFFCRKSNLKREISKLGDGGEWWRRGLGTLVHVTPSNIPMNFALSFLFGFLAGNSNIVKIPLRRFEQARIFLEAWDKVRNLNDGLDDQMFCDFDRADPHIPDFVAKADGVLVWGGDKTVEALRRLDRPISTCLWEFPDRYSVALISAAELINCSSLKLDELAQQFFNDTLLVDQNACSSPALVVWVGQQSEIDLARHGFWGAFRKVMQNNHKRGDFTTKVSRAIEALKLGLEPADAYFQSNWYEEIANIWVDDLSVIDMRESRPRFGVFAEGSVSSLQDLRRVNALFDNKLQTLSVFGFELCSVRQFLVENGMGGERVVPIGAALNFDLVWDGKNAIYQLSKIVG